MGKNTYIKGAGIIAAGGIVAKLLGLFFKIPVGRILEGFGYGLYYNSYNIYNLLMTISIIGVPVAISKMIAERASVKNYVGVRQVFRISMGLMLSVGLVSSSVLFFGARWIIDLAGWDPETYYAILGLAFAPFFVSLLSGFRGFFQGMQLMAPTAISQIIEALVRVLLGIGLCYYLTTTIGPAEGAGGASSGALFGAVAAAAFLVFAWWVFNKDFKGRVACSQSHFPLESRKKIVKRLIQIAVPITMASAIVSLFGIINSFTYVPRLSVAGFDLRSATVMFGDYGLAQTMINVPLTFSTAMSITLVPAISESFVLKSREAIRHKTEVAIRVILLLALPSAIGLSVFSDEIFLLLFPQSQYGGAILRFFAYSAVLIMFSNTMQSILQGLDHFYTPVKHLIPGLAVNFVFNLIFVSMPSINIFGLVISNISAYFLIGFLNYRSVKKLTGVKIHFVQTIGKPVMAAATMGIFGKVVYHFLFGFFGNALAVLMAIFASIAFYVVVLVKIKGLTEQEIHFLPGRNKLKKVWDKVVKK